MKKKVLIVEDELLYQELWKDGLKGRVEIISATSIKEAEEKFAANPDIDAIVMDACVPGCEPTTFPLVRKIRETYSGPMIAASGCEEFRDDLLREGCDHEGAKWAIVVVLERILGL